MDKNEILGSKEILEDNLRCHNCIWRGNQHGYTTIKCEMYEVKPFAVLGGNKTTECDGFIDEEDAE